MNTRTSGILKRPLNVQTGLPVVKYRPPVVATLLAAALLFLVFAALTFFGVGNVLTQLGRVQVGEPGSSGFSAAICGLMTLTALGAMAFFGFATLKGIRDLNSPMYYARGSVAQRRSEGRKAANWLTVNLDYAGPDRGLASRVTDEQQAASVDRSDIFQPRFPSPLDRRRESEVDIESLVPPAPPPSKPVGAYLSPERIRSSAPDERTTIEGQKQDVTPTDDEAIFGPQTVFRIDFAAGAGFRADEEVVIAYSPNLQHVYYVARLRNGEWESFRNKALI